MAVIELDNEQPRRNTLNELTTFLQRHPGVLIGGILLILIVVMAVLAPYLGTIDPQELSPIRRLRPPNAENWFGTDQLGRDVYSRVLFGTRISLIVGFTVAVLSTAIGLFIGLVVGFSRWIDTVVMRVMDGLMAIPPVLLAIALMALTKANIQNVIVAITIAEIPRMTRLVRSVALNLRGQAFVEAARAVGTSNWRILWRHIVPNTLAPVIVQATYVGASAIIIEAILSFLGAGTPPTTPSWGNIIAEGRTLFLVAAYLILIPSAFLSVTVLAINLLGDGFRDALDPRQASAL
ncbi:MAG TPA: ABC transporter permease [Ktedonobacterales bacterium]|nr:ABC transporter permease [Ktedonobacterales bacterium]